LKKISEAQREGIPMSAQVDPLTNLGGKTAGQLIRSADWNALVTALDNLQTQVATLSASVDQRFNTVNQSIQALTSDQASLTTRVGALESALGNYYRVTLSTNQTIFALGEMAVISVQVTDLAGKPLTFTAQTRPWITFLSSWGRLLAEAGFDVLGGFGDRSISVRTDTQGICRVHLQPDHMEGFTPAAETDIHKTITATVQANNKTFAELIRTSDTPVTMKATGALSLLSTEYERADTVNMRQFVDSYYERNPRPIAGSVLPSLQIWRDYRASVMCFATFGDDPHAGDFTRGTGSLAVAFRDWIAPWYNLEYSANTATLLTNYRDRLSPKITANLDESVGLIKQEVDSITAGGGLLKQRRDYDVVHQALDQLTSAQPPAFLNALTESVKDAIQIQQTLGAAHGAAANPGVAFKVFTQAATRGDVSVAAVNAAVSAVQSQVAQVQGNISDVTKQVSTLQVSLTSNGAKLDSALADGGIIHNLQADVSTVKGQVGTLQLLNLNPTDIKSKLDLVTSLDNRVGLLETKK
jgi:hypothetical protein